jgi:hypothetical protein
MKKIMFLIAMMFAFTFVNAQEETLYKRMKVYNIETGDSVWALVPYTPPQPAVVVEKKETRRERKERLKEERTNNERYENSRRGYVLDKKELGDDHELDMEKEGTKQVKAKADGGKWQKREVTIVVPNGPVYGNSYPVYNNRPINPYNDGRSAYCTPQCHFVPTGPSTGYWAHNGHNL